MRYVILICLCVGFLLWDGVYNNGRYLNAGVKQLVHVTRLLN
ncbi:hypothetical protein [Mesorhizobium sp. NBSH29]|nr:hypothetical protein [Mesorhizobium sp. NBSH29]